MRRPAISIPRCSRVPRPNYSVTINDNGTPLDFSDDVVTVADISASRVDGTDHLTHIERLQFADQSR